MIFIKIFLKIRYQTQVVKDTYEVVPYYKKNINNINKNILISAHGNSIRALCKYLFDLSNDNISKLEIPTGNTNAEIKNDKAKSGKYLDSERAKDLIIFNNFL